MATTLEQVCDYLRADGRRYLVDLDGEQVVCRVDGANGRHEVELRLSEDGECLHLRVPRLVSIGESPHAALLFARILELHYQIKLGRFGLDPVDGEIDCEIILPLDDAPLTHRQLRRVFGTLVLLVDQQLPRFKAILATGEDPGEDESAHHDAFLEQVAAVLGLSREELARELAAGRFATLGEDDG